MSADTAFFPLSMKTLEAGPAFSTKIMVGSNKGEVRNANWQDARWEFNAMHAVKNRADAHTLLAFFLNRYGRERSFLLLSGDDYKIPQAGATPQSIGTGDGSTTQFQITKQYADQGYTYERKITKPSQTSSDLYVYKNGILQTYTTHYTYSSTTGIITFVSAPTAGHVIAVTLEEFYVPVRFDLDKLPIEAIMWYVSAGVDRSLHQLPQIPMVEVDE